MSFSIENAREAVTALNRKLDPIAKRPVDRSDPNWLAKLRDMKHPLDQLGIRTEAESLMASLLADYAGGTPSEREMIRGLLRENTSFAWATGVPDPQTTPQGFRQHLLLLSANDLGTDYRDVIMCLDALIDTAKKAGVDTAPIIAEINSLSSKEFQSLLARPR